MQLNLNEMCQGDHRSYVLPTPWGNVAPNGRGYLVALIAGLMVAGIAPRPASAQVELITNGDFETGNLTGWTLANQPLGSQYDVDVPATGSFAIDDADGVAPLSGLSTLGPAGGDFYALSDMTAQGTHTLLQSFTVPINATSVTLSFDMYVYDWYGAGAAIDVAGLDHTTGGTNQPNQHARVDLLNAAAFSFATDGGSVVQNFYLGVDPEAALGQAPVYRGNSFNLTGVALPGQTYQLRFGTVDNQYVLNQGVDNVSVLATLGAVVPEPATGLLLFVGAASGGIITLCRRRK